MLRHLGVAAAALAALCALAPPALAHEGNPNYRSEVTGRLRFTASERSTVLVRIERRGTTRWRAERDFDITAYNAATTARARGCGASG